MNFAKLYHHKKVNSFAKRGNSLMRRSTPILIILLAVVPSFWSPSQAQITITVDEIPAVPGVIMEYAVRVGDSILVDLGSLGGPQTWDFTQPPPPDTVDPVEETIVDLEDTPFGDLYPTANLVIETEAVTIIGIGTAGGYQFMRLDEENLGFLGVGFQDTAGNRMGINLESPLTMIPLPLQNEATWYDEEEFTGEFRIPNPEGSPVPGDSLDVKIDLVYTSEGQVDGWGTVEIPYGEFEALRVRRHEITQVEVSVFVFGMWLSIPELNITLAVYIYDWYVEDLGAVATITSRPNEEDSLFSYAVSFRRLVDTNAFEKQPGDVNGDGIVNVQDVVTSVNHILEIEALEGDEYERADCNGDEQIDLLDVFGIVSVILGVGECEPGGSKPEVTQEILEYFETLKPYFSENYFDRFMILVKGETGVPNRYGLAQNYPNPFNASTDIRYQIPDEGSPIHTTLKVYNMLGQEVGTLVDEDREPGQYKVTWDGKDSQGTHVASGVYLYRFTSGDFTATRRMLLMK